MIQIIEDYHLPTTASRSVGVNGGIDYFVGVEMGGEFQFAFNWFSGDVTMLTGGSGGFYAGTPRGIHLKGTRGAALTWNASEPGSLAGPSSYISGEAGLDLGVTVTGELSTSMAVNYADVNGDKQYDGNDITLISSPYKDPIFKGPVVTVGGNLNVGGNVLPNGVEGGVHFGAGASQDRAGFNLYNFLHAAPRWHVFED